MLILKACSHRCDKTVNCQQESKHVKLRSHRVRCVALHCGAASSVQFSLVQFAAPVCNMLGTANYHLASLVQFGRGYVNWWPSISYGRPA